MWGNSKSMLVRIFATLAICVVALPTYSQQSKAVDPEQADQPCMPPDTYTAHPGDPPFGVHVQTTAKDKNKNYVPESD